MFLVATEATMEYSIARLLEPQPLTNLSELHEDVISKILSFTTQRDVCRLAGVSRRFRSAANSDIVWNRWIPPQCLQQILSTAVAPIAYFSKKELYLRLCDSILTDEGKKMFWLERFTGKIGYMLSARELNIVWGDTDSYWGWPSRNSSRFSECAKLKSVCWLEVRGRIDCRLLSANTEYRVVFVLKFGKRPYGWREVPIKFSVTTPFGEVFERSRLLGESSEESEGSSEEGEDYDTLRYEEGDDYDDLGWLQLVVGTVRRDGDYDDSSAHIEFCMKEVDGGHWKRGLFLDGVRIEPITA